MQSFSAREVGRFGAPSLITRTTNDVQQVQMLALMTFTLMVAAPIMCVGGVILALRQDVPLSSLLLIIVPVLVIAVSLIIRKMRPLFRSMQVRIDKINRIMREQITGIRVIRAFVRDQPERERFGAANDELMTVGLGTGRLMSLMFPTVMIVINVSSVAVLWFGGHRIDSRPDADRCADGVPDLPHADPDGGHDGDVHVHHGAAGRGVRRAHPGGARHRLERRAAGRTRSRA